MVMTVILMGGGLMLLERIVPDQILPKTPDWWGRVILINFIQLGIVLLGGVTWDTWFQSARLFQLSEVVTPFWGGLLAYLVTTFQFYWWHRWRHDSQWLWLGLHQLHHSAGRIETITSFYKHPFEILMNSVIMGVTTYSILGLSHEAAAWLTFFAAAGEFFYHMNIRTPHWVGYFIQRPEMHRIHHKRGKHYNNFADLPIWDMLFGTYENPLTTKSACGFGDKYEIKFWQMLCCQNAFTAKSFKISKKVHIGLCGLLIFLGSLQFLGYISDVKAIRGLAFASAASPLPLVFSHFRGIEPFTSEFTLETTQENGTVQSYPITPELYSQLKGPYNRRNVYGAAFAVGPKMQSATEKQMITDILTYGLCRHVGLPHEFGIQHSLNKATVIVKTKSFQQTDVWKKEVSCFQ